MKRSLYILTLLALTACSKSATVDPADELTGTWRLTTYCKSSSSSACITVAVPADKGVFITFDADGRFNEFYENTKPVEYGFLGCGGGSYEREGNDVRIRATCMSSSTGRLMKVVSVTANQLVLNPFDTGEYNFLRK